MKALIIEDEPLAAQDLQIILKKESGLEVVAIVESVSETLEWLDEHGMPELIFMDIHLADDSSFEIFDRVEITCPVIFTTAYDEYALKAFKVNSIDYLVKPVSREAVQKSLNKLSKLTGKSAGPQELIKFIESFKTGIKYKTHFLVPVKGDKLIPVSTEELACFYIETSQVHARTFADKSYIFEYTLDELMGMLNPSDFFRANRQFIISRKAIKDIDFWFNSRLSINLKVTVSEKILISKARVQEFREWYSSN